MEIDNTDEDVQALLNDLPGQESAAQSAAPDLGVEADALNKALGIYTNGAISDYTSIPDLLSARSQNEELTAKISDYEAKSAISPYHNPVVEKINTFFAEGKSNSHVLEFLKFQSMDLEGMSNEAAIKQDMRFKHPGLSDKQIDLMFSKKYPSLDEDDADYESNKQLQEAEIIMESQTARESLKGQKSSFDNVENDAQAEAKAAEVEQNTRRWNQYVSGFVQKSNVMSLGFEDKNGKFNLDFNVPANKEVDDYIVNGIVAQAVSQGIPLNSEGAKVVQSRIEDMRFLTYRKDIMKAIFEDGVASAKAAKVREYANPNAIPEGKNNLKTHKPKPKGREGFI